MMIQTSRHNGSTWRKCGETHVKKLLEEERLNTKSGFLLIPWGNWMCKRKRKWHWTQDGQEQWKQKLTTQQQIKMLRKHQVKQDHIDKLAKQLKKQQDKESGENCIWSPRSSPTSYSRQKSQWRTRMGILSQNQKKERWVEHIELNRLTPETLPNIQAAESNLPIDGNKPSKTKIKGAITTLKNGKAAGFGEKTAEAIKADTETSVNKFAQPHQEDLWERKHSRGIKRKHSYNAAKERRPEELQHYQGIMLLLVLARSSTRSFRRVRKR